MSAVAAIGAIVTRDLARARRQHSRLLGGLARPFMWLLLVGAGFNAIARVDGAISYQAFVLPGVVVMAALFGGMLTAIATVYDREFGMLRLMLASPAGLGVVLVGRVLAATAVACLQGGIVLLAVPFVLPVGPADLLAAAGALVVAALVSSVLGLLVASPLQSVENFAGVINVVLFPLLFLSGALYPTAGMPPVLGALVQLNPITYAVDLMRLALGQPAEFGAARSLAISAAAVVVAFVAAAWLFDPERRMRLRHRPREEP